MFIRTRDSILTTGGVDNCKCVTCPAVKPRLGIGSIQAGHFPEISGRLNSVLFEERGVHGQCYQCNHHKHGNPNVYMKFMQKVYGQRVIDELIALKNRTVKYTKEDYENIRAYYIKEMTVLLHNFSKAHLQIDDIDEALLF